MTVTAAAEPVRCVRRARPRDYGRARRRAFGHYRLVTASPLWPRTRRPLAQKTVSGAARFPAFFTAVVHRLA